jgi:glutaredoxin
MTTVRRVVVWGLALFLLVALGAPHRSAHAEEPAAVAASGSLRLDVYTREGCPHCEDAKDWLARIQDEQPGLEIVFHDVGHDLTARAQLEEAVRSAGLQIGGVPAFVVGDRVILGFSDADRSGPDILALLEADAPAPPVEDDAVCLPDAEDAACEEPLSEEAVELPLFGRVDVGRLGLPVFTVLIGLVDGFNPCAMWVLLFLLSLLVNLQDRKKMVAIAGTFVLVSGVVYFGFMAAWLNFFFLLGLSRGVQILLALVALVVAAINVKDFFAFKKGISLSIPESAKPRIYKQARALRKSSSLLAAVGGAAVLAVLVNLVELLCTAGLPAVYTQILARHELSPGGYYGYLALYNIAYMVDDGLMVGVAVWTLSKKKLQESGGRQLKLVSGLVMGVLGLLLLFAPELLLW